MRRLFLAGLTALTVTLGYGCGSSNPAAPSGQNITYTGSLETTFYHWETFNITKTGTMTVTLTWPSSSVDLDLSLTNDSCGTLPYSGGAWVCTDLGHSSESSGTKEVVTRSVTSGQTYRVFVFNYAGGTSNWTVTVSIP